MKSQWMEHKGKRFFYTDISNLKLDVNGLKAEMNASTQVITQQPEKSVLMVVDMRNTVVSPDVARLIKETIDQTDRYTRKAAIVGLTGVRKALFDIFSKLSRSENAAFDDVEEAKEWVVK